MARLPTQGQAMSELSEILEYNQNFVESGEYDKYFTGK